MIHCSFSFGPIGLKQFLDLVNQRRFEFLKTAFSKDRRVFLVKPLAVRSLVRQVPDIRAVGECANNQRSSRKAFAEIALQDVVMFSVEGQPDGVTQLPQANRVRVGFRVVEVRDSDQSASRALDHGSRVASGVCIPGFVCG
jgi:hypothetical protein